MTDEVLAPQLSTLKDGRWGLLAGRLAWQACPCFIPGLQLDVGLRMRCSCRSCPR